MDGAASPEGDGRSLFRGMIWIWGCGELDLPVARPGGIMAGLAVQIW